MASRFQSYDNTNNDDDEDYYLAPQDQRAFGAGIKRKRVTFIPASDADESTLISERPKPSNLGAKYLSIVLGERAQQSPLQTIASTPPPTTTSSDNHTSTSTHTDVDTDINTTATKTPPPSPTVTCPICNIPLPPNTTLQAHSITIAHQLNLTHSHPPSHVDRQRKGLKYLQEYGWDPDSRLGLGARSEGIRVPVKAKEKRDTTGLGLFSGDVDDGEEEDRIAEVKRKKKLVREGQGGGEGGKKLVKLNAKQVRQMEEEKRKKAEKLRQVFYGKDLSRYLGPEG